MTEETKLATDTERLAADGRGQTADRADGQPVTDADEYSYTVRAPKDRIAVIIGEKGVIKRKIERNTSTILDIDSEEGDITIRGEDALKLFVAREIIRAIARGFSPEFAFLLEKPDYALEVFSISSKSKNDTIRIRSRLIGENGKARRTIEELTGAYISVYGKTVAVIGEFEDLRSARKAVEMILQGSMHSAVFRMLERKRRSEPLRL